MLNFTAPAPNPVNLSEPNLVWDKLLSLTEKVLTTTQPLYIHNLITVQPTRSTRSSSLVTLAHPSTSSSLRITDRSFHYASPRLWNQLPASLHQPRTNLSNSDSPSSSSGTSSIGLSTHHFHQPSLLHSFIPGLKPSFSANPSHRSLHFLLPDWLHGLMDCLPTFLSISVFLLFFCFPLFIFWFHAVD